MKLRAQITIDLAASSYADAATHQRALEQFLASLREVYPEAELLLRERRERKAASEYSGTEAHVLPMMLGRSNR